MEENKKSDEMKSLFERIKKQEIRVRYSELEHAVERNQSKIGGNPDLPPDFEWPYYSGESYDGEIKNRPLSFLAQFNMSEVSKYDTENLLPKTGMISFFYELMSQDWGYDIKHKGCARVFYFEDCEKLQKAALPSDLEEECVFPEFSVSFSNELSLPGFNDLHEINMEMDELIKKDKWKWEEYYECLEEFGYEYDGWGERTKFLGYADVIQSPMEEKCEIISRGYSTGSPEAYAMIPQNERVSIKQVKNEWIMLFQMGTIENDSYEMMFGDCGHIYFWIRKQDLLECNFNNCWLILQCT
ncbi:MAG: YwqG family protein [Coprococcus sp.]